MSGLAKTHGIIVSWLRGAGASAKRGTGYDMKTMSPDIHRLVKSFGSGKATIVGSDIGAFASGFRRTIAAFPWSCYQVFNGPATL